jgi:hypothetical protein
VQTLSTGISTAQLPLQALMHAGSWARLPGFESVSTSFIIDNFDAPSSFINNAYQYPEGLVLGNSTFTYPFINFVLKPPSEKMREAFKAYKAEKVKMTYVDGMLYQLTLPSTPSDPTVKSMSFNFGQVITGRRIHGLQFGFFLNTPESPWPNVITPLPIEQLTVLVAGTLAMQIDQGLFPKARRPWPVYRTVTTASPNTWDWINDTYTPTWIFPKTLPTNVQLEDHETALYSHLFPECKRLSYARLSTHPAKLTSLVFRDGGYGELDQVNVQFSGRLCLQMESLTARAVPVLRTQTSNISEPLPYQTTDAPPVVNPILNPFKAPFPLDLQNTYTMPQSVMASGVFHPSAMCVDIAPDSGVYPLCAPNSNIIFVMWTRRTVEMLYDPADGSVVTFV